MIDRRKNALKRQKSKKGRKNDWLATVVSQMPRNVCWPKVDHDLKSRVIFKSRTNPRLRKSIGHLSARKSKIKCKEQSIIPYASGSVMLSTGQSDNVSDSRSSL